MNRREIRQQETELLDRALEALHHQTGLKGRVVEVRPRLRQGLGRREPDARIEIQGRERPIRFVAEVKLVDRFETVSVFVLPGIGRLVRVDRKARMGRDPATGMPIKIPSKHAVKFRLARQASGTTRALIAPTGHTTVSRDQIRAAVKK